MAEPTPQELIEVAQLAIQGQGDFAADFVRGSDYESLMGPAAMIYARQALRDADMFAANKLHTARGEDLTLRVSLQYGVDRILDTRGRGTALLSRDSVAGGGGTIWAGTRIAAYGPNPKFFRVRTNKAVSAIATTVTVDVEAIIVGVGGELHQTGDLRLDDPTWDSNWRVASIDCADGTNYESDSALIARTRRGRRDARPGHAKLIKSICNEAGAANVEIFRSDYGNITPDGGLNVCYVGDLGYSSSPALVKACSLALRAGRVLGDHLQVLPMQRVDLAVAATVTLRAQPQSLNTERLERLHRLAILQYMGGSTGGFTYTISGIRGAIIRPSADTQDVTLLTPSTDGSILVANAFPAALNRYIVSDIALQYQGP